MKFFSSLTLSVLFCTFLPTGFYFLQPAPRELHHENIGCDMSTSAFKDFLKSGSIKGYFSADQFWAYFEQLHSKYPDHVGERVPLGQTYLGQTIFGFYMGQHLKNHNQDVQNKNIVFITGLHHSREPVTVTMVLYLVIKILSELGVCGGSAPATVEKWRLFFSNNVIFFIPIVNQDSYKYIEQNWQGPHGAEVLMVRKNRNISPECDEFSGGVDLNRNYSFMFALNESGSSGDPCQEDYRGSRPFSEPETLTIKRFVEAHPNIVTGINMHSYGNAWIFPFNFVHDSKNHLLEKKKPKFYNFYREFVRDMKRKHEQAEYGNAQGTVQYPTNGEAGDWLTEMHNIINLDVELGNLDKRSDQFYPPKSIIPSICAYNFRVFRQFFWKHNVHLELHQVKRNRHKRTATFVVFNKSVSSLTNFHANVSPVFRTKRSRQLNKKKKRAKKRKFKNDKQNKRKFKLNEERILASSTGFEVKFALKANCHLKTSDLQKASNNQIRGTLHGRYFLEIQITFDDPSALEKLAALNLDVHYGKDFVKKYEFLAHTKKNKIFSHSRTKRGVSIFRHLGIFQERRLKSGEAGGRAEPTRRQKRRAEDRPKLIV